MASALNVALRGASAMAVDGPGGSRAQKGLAYTDVTQYKRDSRPRGWGNPFEKLLGECL